MRIQFLGTGGYHPNSRRQTAGLFLAEQGILIDAGTGTYRLPELLRTEELDVFLTHGHLDHVIGLTYLLVPLELGQLKECRVHAAPEVLETVRQHLFAPGLFPMEPRFDYRELAERVELGGLTLTHHPLKHPGGSRGYKLTDGSVTLVAITDTTVDGTYDDFVRGADVLIHECYFSDENQKWCEVTGHSATTMVADLARRTAVGRLYLTHIDPYQPGEDPVGLATARKLFLRTFVAEDLLTIEC